MKRSLFLASFLGLLIPGAVAEAKGPVVTVSLVEGSAQALPKKAVGEAETGPPSDGAWRALKIGQNLQEGDAVRTGEKGKLELKLADGSRLRLGPGSTITLNASHLGEGGSRQVSVSLWVGRLWAKVAKKVGGDSSFEVETHNAVAGVRGTSFAVLAQADLSSMVKVYTGTVGVRKGSSPASARNRKQVPGPSRIDQKQWEEVIASQMKAVKITALGEIAPAEDFADAGPELEWAMWNQERDQKVQ
ncbi:MAG: FecR domain-containing protein [Deltaproteobacteria bacterium]|jgi:hypothetical protein|nr:FecR domain-containing protein [Deltaproteobacteria bacterium]